MTDYAKARELGEQAREKEWTRPSFAKQLFLGDLRLDLVYPAPTLAEEAAKRGEDFVRAVRRYLDAHVDPAEIERTAQVPDEVVKGLGELGAFGMTISEEYGGLGLPWCTTAARSCSSGPYCPAWRRCCRRTSRSACRSRSRCSAPRSRSGSTCRGARAARCRRSC